ncbi:MAG: hypothetical protein AAF766_18485, partial [Cyanobacteria bacterium P01_D01_bin.14]
GPREFQEALNDQLDRQVPASTYHRIRREILGDPQDFYGPEDLRDLLFVFRCLSQDRSLARAAQRLAWAKEQQETQETV